MFFHGFWEMNLKFELQIDVADVVLNVVCVCRKLYKPKIDKVHNRCPSRTKHFYTILIIETHMRLKPVAF